MKNATGSWFHPFVLAWLASASGGSPLLALMISAEDYPVDPTRIAKPCDELMAAIIRYPNDTGARITSVAIAPNYIMTAGHWGTAINYRVRREGDPATYRVADKRSGYPAIDIQVLRVERCTGEPPNVCGLTENANWTQWAGLYDQQDEANKESTIDSYGPLQSGNGPWGYLHWARNLMLDRSVILGGPYMKYQLTHATTGDSGSPWFIKNGWDWQVAGLQKTTGVNAQNVCEQVEWIEAIIDTLNNARPPEKQEVDPHPPPPETLGSRWTGTVSGAWDEPGNWDPAVPGVDDITIVDLPDAQETGPSPWIDAGTAAVAEELGIGYRRTGELAQTGGTLTVKEGVYLGIKPDGTGTLSLSGGMLSADTLRVGDQGTGTLRIADSSVAVKLANLSFGPAGSFDAVAGTTIDMAEPGTHYDHRFTIHAGAVGTNLSGLGQTHFRVAFADGEPGSPTVFFQIEAAGAPLSEADPASSFSTANFVIDTLSVGVDPNTLGQGTTPTQVVIQVADISDNQPGPDPEAVYANHLIILPGATFTFWPADGYGCRRIHLYYRNGGAPKRLMPGDANLDGTVDTLDYAVVGLPKTCDATWADGDFDGDRDVDADDLRLWRFNRTVLYVNDALTTGANTGDTWENALHGFVETQSPLARALSMARGENCVADAYAGPRDGSVLAGSREIWVAAGTYVPTSDGDRAKSFLVTNHDAIYGGFHGTETSRSERDVLTHVTILSGDLNGDDGSGGETSDNSYHVVTTNNAGAPAILDGFTITAGNAVLDDGGGISNLFGRPTVARCNLVRNKGGAMYVEGGSPTITHSLFGSNSAASGGGIFNHRGNVSLTNCVLHDNIAQSSGGGIHNDGGDMTLVNCVLFRNLADSGGAIGNPSGHLSMTNSIARGNTSTSGPQPQVPDTTTVTYSCIQDRWEGLGNTGADPRFVSPETGDFRLAAGSPCLDAGNNAAVPVDVTTDLAGNPRFAAYPGALPCRYAPGTCGTPPIVDMGAYEFNDYDPLADDDRDGIPNGNDLCPDTIPGITVDAQGCPPLIPGDTDRDGDVDDADMRALAGCRTGPAVSYDARNLPPACRLLPDEAGRLAVDFDRDADVDQSDFGIFQPCYSGEGKPGDPLCAN